MAEGQTKTKSLSWMNTRKPAQGDSPRHNLEGPKVMKPPVSPSTNPYTCCSGSFVSSFDGNHFGSLHWQHLIKSSHPFALRSVNKVLARSSMSAASGS
jgi:hypothetical protein